MVVIQRTPWRDYVIRAAVLSGLVAVIALFGGAIKGAPIGGTLTVIAVATGFIFAFALVAVPFVYPTFAVDFASRTVRMRFRDVPISSLTQAWRRVADTRAGGVLLFYRLRSTAGPRIRLIVAGRGFPVLDTPARQALLDLLAEAPIEQPPARASRISTRWVRVGVAQMRAELLRFDLDLTVGFTDEELRADAEEHGFDPDDPMRDDRLR